MAIPIPPALHDVLGTRQSVPALAAIAVAVGAVLVVFFSLQGPHTDVPIWRRMLALVFLLDIAAGAVANLTAGTNDHYAQSARRRWLFIAVHIHLPLFAVLLGLPLAPYVGVWAYVIAAAAGLNLAVRHPDQRVVAGAVMVIGLMALPLLGLDPLGGVAAALFIVKVCYAFAVNHSGMRNG